MNTYHSKEIAMLCYMFNVTKMNDCKISMTKFYQPVLIYLFFFFEMLLQFFKLKSTTCKIQFTSNLFKFVYLFIYLIFTCDKIFQVYVRDKL